MSDAPRKPSKKAIREPQLPSYPVHPPEGATHFRLRKGGRQGTICKWTDSSGVEQQMHPIEEFTAKEIAKRWGYDPEFSVHFRELGPSGKWEIRGAPKAFGLAPPDARVPPTSEDGTSRTTLVAPGGESLGSAIQTLTALRDLSHAETMRSVEMVRAGADAQLAAQREQSNTTLSMMKEMFSVLARANQAPPAASAIDPSVALVLQQLANGQAALTAAVSRLSEEEEEPDDDDLTDDQKLERFMKNYRKDGLAALGGLLGDESIEGAFKLLMKAKAKAPEIAEKVGPILRARLDEVLAPPKPKAAPPPAAPVVTTVKKIPKANGAVPPPPSPPMKDDLTPNVE